MFSRTLNKRTDFRRQNLTHLLFIKRHLHGNAVLGGLHLDRGVGTGGGFNFFNILRENFVVHFIKVPHGFNHRPSRFLSPFSKLQRTT